VVTVALETTRLILRQWKKSDYIPFAEMSADPEVMRFFPEVLTRAKSDQLALDIETLIDNKGWGLWAVELKETTEFTGFVGLHYQNQDIPEAPFIEIGWRLSSTYWGVGYAQEAANAALKFAFEVLNETAVYAFTTLENAPSRKVMSKLGMVNSNTDFNHPKLAKGHPLERHCLYKITDTIWRELWRESLVSK
jgi:RimJ/RimL family protein N-acetyltransferase